MKAIKILLWVVMLLVVLAVGLVVVLTKLVDPNDYKPQIESLVEKQTGRTLSLEGDLSLTFFPWVGVETGKLSLSNAEGFGDRPMIAVGNARMKAKLLPLLKEQIEVDTIVLEKPDVSLMRRKDGTTNWDDLVAASGNKAAESASPGEQRAGTVASLAIQGVSISDGRLWWTDETTDQTTMLENINLSTGSLVPGEPLDISLSVDVSGNVIPEATHFSIDTAFTLNEARDTIKLDNTEFAASAKSRSGNARMDSMSYNMKSGIVDISGLLADVVLNSVKTSLKAPAVNFDQGSGNLQLPELSVEQGDASVQLSFQGADLLGTPGGSGKLGVNAADINALLRRNQIVVPQLTQTLKNASVNTDFSLVGNEFTLDDLSVNTDVNQLSTSVIAKAINLNIKTQAASLREFEAEQQDFKLSLGAVDVPAGLFSDSSKMPAPLISGDFQIELGELASLLARNGIEITLPDIPLKDLSLSATANTKSGAMSLVDTRIKASYQDQPVSLDISSLQFNPDSGDTSVKNLVLVQGDARIKISLSGNLAGFSPERMRLTGSVNADVTSLPDLLKKNSIEVELPEGVVSNVALNSGFALEKNNLLINKLDLKIDEMTVKGDVAINNLSRPDYRFNLAINQLDIDRLTAGSGESVAADQPSTAEQLLLPVAPLRGMDVDGQAKIGTLTTTGLTLEDVSIAIKSADNVVRFVPVTARAFGGNIESELVYDVSSDTPALKVVNKVSGMDIGALLSALEVSEKIEGTGTLNANLSARGKDPDALIAGLAGTIDFNLRDGALKGYDLQAALLNIQNQIAQFKGEGISDRSAPEAETRFVELGGIFKVNDGVFRNDDFSMKAPLFRVNGRGTMDLPAERIDYKVAVNVVESLEGQDGKSLGNLKGVNIPLKVYGPLTAPSFTLDLARLLKDQASKNLKKKVLQELAGSQSSLNLSGSSADDASGAISPQEAPTENLEEAAKQELKKKLKNKLLKGLFD